MTGPTTEFFENLAERGQVPLFQRMTGTLRFDIEDGKRVDHWYVTLEKGDVTVSHDDGEADGVIRTERKLFDGMVSGTVNPMAAFLRGLIVPQGDLGLILAFQRAFPGPPNEIGRASCRERV